MQCNSLQGGHMHVGYALDLIQLRNVHHMCQELINHQLDIGALHAKGTIHMLHRIARMLIERLGSVMQLEHKVVTKVTTNKAINRVINKDIQDTRWLSRF